MEDFVAPERRVSVITALLQLKSPFYQPMVLSFRLKADENTDSPL